ncbi:zinc finger protein 345-like [Leguminivora glycinivorella]|uniref:zinc finger protein 345-like n=1 Tax=Leguminivora glycinivorella TaxID=1035111 RepID=UPI00200F9097|nr:zinc finger protein 345-like [Leguminivora glycinivorella]
MAEIKTEYSYLLACRICLATDIKLFGIYEHQLEETFAGVMGTTLSAWDGLPQYVCSCCRALLLKSSALRGRCHRAQDLLKEMLAHQQFLTTDIIRTIDRISNQLSLHLAINNRDQPIEIIYDEDHKEYIEFKDNEPPIVDDVFNDDHDLDDDYDIPLKQIEKRISPEKEPPKKILRKRKVVKDVKKSKNVKKVAKITIKKRKMKENEIEDKTETYKRKKKGFKRFFSCEDDYVKFENKYNISIVKVSEEEQQLDMAARKQSANYLRALLRCGKCHKGFLSEATFENHQKVHDPVSGEKRQRGMAARKQSANYLRALLRCGKCHKGFLSEATFENHQKVHDPIMGSNECHLCFARFKHPTRLRRHMETHTLKFICKLCPLVTRHRGMAMMHSDFHSGKTFECKYCGLTFKKKTTFNTHIRVQHPLENASGGACDVCGETFIGKRGLQQHKTMAHRKMPIKELKCSVCGVQFENLDAVVKHSANGCDPKLRACEQCGDAFDTGEELAAHAESAHVKPVYKCDDCDKTFATKSSLGTHVDRVHLKIKPKKSGLYQHHLYPKRTQIKRVEEICEVCGKGYPTDRQTCYKSGLYQHHLYPKRTQIKRVEEICEVCGKGYPSSTWLKYHQRTHTGERPYKCPSCPKSYMTPAALQSHSVSHTGVRRWQCSLCPKTFLHQSSIYKHKLVHTGEKPFSCHICSKTFTQSGSLATHVKYVHMKLKPPPRRRRHQPT